MILQIHIIRASSLSSQKHNSNVIGEEEFTSTAKKTRKRGKKLDLLANHAHEDEEMSSPQELQPDNRKGSEQIKDADQAETNGSACRKLRKRDKLADNGKSEKVVLVEEKDKSASLRPRKKPAPKLFRKKT